MFKLNSQSILVGAVLFSIVWFFNYILGSFLIIAAACVIGIYAFNFIGNIFIKGTMPKVGNKAKKDEPEPFEEREP